MTIPALQLTALWSWLAGFSLRFDLAALILDEKELLQDLEHGRD